MASRSPEGENGEAGVVGVYMVGTEELKGENGEVGTVRVHMMECGN
jgi:hypothetical protein